MSIYRIASFNLFKFSNASNKDLDKLVDIIRDNHIDIIAFQEIFNRMSLEMVLNRLGRLEWDGVWAQPTFYSSNASEGFAYVWNKRRVELSPKSPHAVNSSYSLAYHVDVGNGQSKLVRDPYYVRFITKSGFAEIRLINAHLMFAAKGDDEEESEISLSDVARRKKEAEVLLNNIYTSLSNEVTTRSVYSFVLGDYNLNLRDSGAGWPYIDGSIEYVDRNRRSVRIKTIQGEKTTLKRPPKAGEDDINNDVWANNYDHFSFYDTDKYNCAVIKAGRINTLPLFEDYREHRSRLSDHVPIIMELDMSRY